MNDEKVTKKMDEMKSNATISADLIEALKRFPAMAKDMEMNIMIFSMACVVLLKQTKDVDTESFYRVKHKAQDFLTLLSTSQNMVQSTLDECK